MKIGDLIDTKVANKFRDVYAYELPTRVRSQHSWTNLRVKCIKETENRLRARILVAMIPRQLIKFEPSIELARSSALKKDKIYSMTRTQGSITDGNTINAQLLRRPSLSSGFTARKVQHLYPVCSIMVIHAETVTSKDIPPACHSFE